MVEKKVQEVLVIFAILFPGVRLVDGWIFRVVAVVTLEGNGGNLLRERENPDLI